MFDTRLRSSLGPRLEAVGVVLHRWGLRPSLLTAVGLVLGIGSAIAVGLRLWWVALALWLVSRLADGLDGHVARVAGTASAAGGFLDIMADFAVYGGFVVGVGIAVPESRVACLVLLVTYYLSGSAFLAFSSASHKLGVPEGDERSLHFLAGLAEGFETIVAHSLLCLVPALAGPTAVVPVAWVWSGMVAVSVVQRVIGGFRLRRGAVHS